MLLVKHGFAHFLTVVFYADSCLLFARKNQYLAAMILDEPQRVKTTTTTTSIQLTTFRNIGNIGNIRKQKVVTVKSVQLTLTKDVADSLVYELKQLS